MPPLCPVSVSEGHFPHDVSMYLFLILCRHLPLSCFCLSRTDTEEVGTVFLASYAMVSFAHCDLGLGAPLFADPGSSALTLQNVTGGQTQEH